MEIKSLTVENFRSHAKYELELEKVTIVTGPNGSGKSTLLEAAATVLIGENSWTARDGIKLKNLIRKGAKSSTVSLTGRKTISRIITASGSKILLDGKDPLTQFELLNNLKISAGQVKASLIPTAFLSLTATEQQNALYGVLGTKMTLEDVSKYVPASETWDKLSKRWKEDHEDEEFVDLDKLYDFVYQNRRNYKSKTAAPQTSPEHDDLIKELGEISKEIASANFKNQERKAKGQALARLPEMEQDLEALKEKLDEDAETRWKEAQAEEMEWSKKEGIAQASLQQAKDELAKFTAKTGKGGKVVCPVGLECPHDENAVKSRQTLLKGQVVAKEGEYKSVRGKLKEAAERFAAISAKVSTIAQARHRIEALEPEIEKTRKLALELDATDEIDIDALKEKKEAIEKKVSQVMSRPAEADRTIEHLNAIVEALAVDGIKAKIVKKGIADLEEEASVALSQFKPMKIRFFLDQEFRPCIIHMGSEVAIGELSEGERLVTSLVLQDVFAQRSGVNLVVVDNVDLLDSEAYRKFVSVALGLKSKVLAGLANFSHQAAVPSQKDGIVKVVDLGPSSRSKGEGERQGPSKKRPADDIL